MDPVPTSAQQTEIRSLALTSQELDASCHPAHVSGDELGHTATHERSQCHQKEEAATQACHHCADPPFSTWDGLEGCIAATLLHHNCCLTTFIPHRIGTPPKSAKGH